MRARSVVVPVLFAALALLQLGCAASVAPEGWLPYAQEAQQEAYGGWLDMEVGSHGVTSGVRGELLAIGEDSVFTLSGETVTATALASVQRAKLEVYDSRSGVVAGVAVLGTLLTATHGFGLILTAPLWVIVGTVSSAGLSHEGKHRIETPVRHDETTVASNPGPARESWRDLRLYARFPQGMPPGLDRTQLHERPATNRARPGNPDSGSIREE